MSRINTNIASLQAIGRLNRNNSDLATRLERLSTGLKINTGKDAPAALIASETLRSEINGINQAIDNSKCRP
jgi:flagellin